MCASCPIYSETAFSRSGRCTASSHSSSPALHLLPTTPPPHTPPPFPVTSQLYTRVLKKVKKKGIQITMHTPHSIYFVFHTHHRHLVIPPLSLLFGVMGLAGRIRDSFSLFLSARVVLGNRPQHMQATRLSLFPIPSRWEEVASRRFHTWRSLFSSPTCFFPSPPSSSSSSSFPHLWYLIYFSAIFRKEGGNK